MKENIGYDYFLGLGPPVAAVPTLVECGHLLPVPWSAGHCRGTGIAGIQPAASVIGGDAMLAHPLLHLAEGDEPFYSPVLIVSRT